jgi:hypothetical protein
VQSYTLRIRLFSLGLASLLALLLGPVVASATARAAGAGSIWTIQTTPNRSTDFNQLSAISAHTASDVWAVGTFRGPSSSAFRTLIEHFDGTSWRAVQSPNSGAQYNELNGVSADSGSDAWAVGFRVAGSTNKTLIERWNGTKWAVVPSPNIGSDNNDLRGVDAISPSDVWAVGAVGFTSATLAEHWDGSAWTVVPTPTPFGGANLTAVAAVSSNDVWAVGAVGDGDDGPFAEHWDGTSWTIAPTAPISGEGLFAGITATSSSDVWAIGSAGSKTLTQHWDGSSWSLVASPNPLPTTKGNNFLTGVTAISPTDVWAVGSTLDFTQGGLEQTMTLQWNGASWNVVDSPNHGTNSTLLLGASSPGGDVVFAAGTFMVRTNRTLVLRTTQG